MVIDTTEVIGLIAATLTTGAFFPQVYKTWKTKNVDGLSLSMYAFFFVGIVLWLVYGILIESIAVILANVITAILAFILLFFKIKYRR